jgi:hypothetical protein
MRYSEFVDRLLNQDRLLQKLMPTDVFDRAQVRAVREADDGTIEGGKIITDAAMLALVRGGLLYALDALDAAHAIFQKDSGDLASYWHGMMHRREGDFDNARYWFRRAGVLPFFGELHSAAASRAETMARQSNWDPYLVTGQCEQERFGADELTAELVALQRAEFDVVFDYCWRKAVES